MKVKELIKELKKHNPEKMVVVYGYEDSYDEVSELQTFKLKLNVHTEDYYGDHERDDNGECEAVCIN